MKRISLRFVKWGTALLVLGVWTGYGPLHHYIHGGVDGPRAVKLAAAHFWMSVVAVLGVFANGLFGYRYLDSIAPSFYYEPKMETLQLWLSIDGAFLTLYALGCFLFLWIVVAGVKYETDGFFEDSNERAKT